MDDVIKWRAPQAIPGMVTIPINLVVVKNNYIELTEDTVIDAYRTIPRPGRRRRGRRRRSHTRRTKDDFDGPMMIRTGAVKYPRQGIDRLPVRLLIDRTAVKIVAGTYVRYTYYPELDGSFTHALIPTPKPRRQGGPEGDTVSVRRNTPHHYTRLYIELPVAMAADAFPHNKPGENFKPKTFKAQQNGTIEFTT